MDTAARSRLASCSDVNETTVGDLPVIKPFAMAFLRMLNDAQTERLRALLQTRRPVTADDLAQVPGLQALVGPSMPLPDPVRAVLGEVLADTSPMAPPDRFAISPFAAITKRAEDASKQVAKIPEDRIAQDLNLGLFKVVQALKSGDLVRADALMDVLSEHFDIPTLEHCGPDCAPELACVLFMKAIYSDENISQQASERLFALLANLPKNAPMLRAIVYNVSLDLSMRRKQFDEAKGAAHRALFHYDAAGESGVAFYVHLYLAVIGLWGGDCAGAVGHLRDARSSLAQFEGAVENDHLILRSFEMIAAYETGAADTFIKHLMSDDDTIPFGELWPSIAAPIISYGRKALATHVTPAAALSWIRRWRVRQWRSRRFDALISAQEALALQDMGRWQEADEILADIEAAEDIEVRLASLASGLDRSAKSQELANRLSECLRTPNLSLRQTVHLRLLAAQSAVARGIEREGARHLGAAIKAASPDAFPAIWSENRTRVAALLARRELRGELHRFPKLKRQIQTLAKTQATDKPADLTQQEFRVLQLLAEAQSNKAIGVRLGIALPTVKFHVKNLCRKTGARNRRDVVQAAIDAAWLSGH